MRNIVEGLHNMPVSKTFVIAEIGSTHDGSFGNAMASIGAVAECGANAVKFQTHIAEAETLADAPMPPYFSGEPRMQYFRRTAFNIEQWHELKAHSESLGLEFLSSPFSIAAVELLEELGMTQYKIPSGEVSNLPMLEVIAETGKPVLLSSGMSSWSELDDAVATIRAHNNEKITVLQCTTEYPCPPENVGLNVMLEMRDRYGLPVGFSDHTATIYAPIAAVTLGASVVEKHFTFSKLMYGSDAANSLDPTEFADMVQGIRSVEATMGNPVDKSAVGRFAVMKEVFEKSLVSVRDISKGSTITREMVGEKKPGTGIPARRLNDVLGMRAKRDIDNEQLLSLKDLEKIQS